MMHPPCDAVRLRLAELHREELYAEAAHERLAQQIPAACVFEQFGALLARFLRMNVDLAGLTWGFRLRIGSQSHDPARDEQASRAWTPGEQIRPGIGPPVRTETLLAE